MEKKTRKICISHWKVIRVLYSFYIYLFISYYVSIIGPGEIVRKPMTISDLIGFPSEPIPEHILFVGSLHVILPALFLQQLIWSSNGLNSCKPARLESESKQYSVYITSVFPKSWGWFDNCSGELRWSKPPLPLPLPTLVAFVSKYMLETTAGPDNGWWCLSDPRNVTYE